MEIATDIIRAEFDLDNNNVAEINNSVACRICLREHEMLCPDTDIFTIAERLYDLFQVKYENLPSLPHRVCERCMLVVQAFTEFRSKVQQCETELQKRYKELKTQAMYRDSTPGLNDNAGDFVPNIECEIIEVDPNQEFDSSDDDFSMESESETEEKQQKQQQKVIINSNDTNNLNDSATMPAAVSNINATSLDQNNGTQTGIEASYKTPCYLCQYCDMAFSNQENCSAHEGTQHDAQFPYACNFCEVRHTNRQTMVAHIRHSHQPDRPYVCTLCGKGFCRRSDLKKHTIVHTGIRPYTCPTCSKGFSRNTNLMKHMRIHTSSKPHVCQLCPRSFGTAQELAAHTRSHSDTKPNQCDECQCSFMRKDQLQAHKLSHLHEQQKQRYSLNYYQNLAKENEYANTNLALSLPEEQTSKYLDQQQPQRQQFINDANDPQHSILAGHLMQQPQQQQQQHQQHRTTSTKSRNFNCNICVKTFTREKDYFRHQALHLEDIYTCKICNISFSRREKLTRHIEKEHASYYICEICNIKFPSDEGLQVHMKIHELHQNVAISNHAASSGGTTTINHNIHHFNQQNYLSGNEFLRPDVCATLTPPQPIRPSAEEIHFYSQMVPTMNLGFYSETRPDA